MRKLEFNDPVVQRAWNENVKAAAGKAPWDLDLALEWCIERFSQEHDCFLIRKVGYGFKMLSEVEFSDESYLAFIMRWDNA